MEREVKVDNGNGTENGAGYGMVVAVDGSAESDAAVRWAAREASLRKMPVTLMHVVEPIVVNWPIPPVQGSITEWQETNARNVIEHARDMIAVADADPDGIRHEIRYAGIVAELVDVSKSATMMVVGSRGLGALGGALLGSVSSGIVHHAHCPVAVIHGNQVRPPDPRSPVLIGIDGSPSSEDATAFAFDEASRRRVDLIALHAWSDVGVFSALGMDWHEYEDQGRELLGERLAGWRERYPDVRVTRQIVCDQPARWLIDGSRHAQLVVVGSHGRGGFAGMRLGSVGSKVARAAYAPVVVVR
ncbi:universal stress protein [Mycolicibacterium goodii]|nr:universal stress protein [Mycolicibacterium goodii]